MTNSGASTPWRLLIILAVATFAYCLPQWANAQTPIVTNGVMDVRNWNQNQSRLAINGTWKFYDHEITTVVFTEEPALVDFPRVWNEIRPDHQGIGFGTYEVTILLPSKVDSISLDIPQIYCSYSLSANGRLITQCGQPGPTEESTKPKWLAQTITIQQPGDSLHLLLRVANFHHHLGGVKDTIYIGWPSSLQTEYKISYWINLLEVIVLMVIGTMVLLLYGRMEKKKKTAYFGLLCITWAVRSLFYNQYILIASYPDFNWLATIRIEYITLYLALIWAMLFTHELFPGESHQVVKYLLVGINGLYILIVLTTSPSFFTRFISLYLGTVALVLLYCVVVVVRAWVNERIGVNFLVIAMLLGAFLFGYDLLSYEGYFAYHPEIFNLGYLTVFLAIGPALLQHLEIMKTKVSPKGVLSYEDLYGKK